MTSAARLRGAGARLVLGAAVLAAGIGIAVGGVVLPAREVPGAAVRLPMSIGAPDLACSGPETALVPAGGRAVQPAGPVTSTVLAASAGSANSSSRVRLRPLSGSGSASDTPAGGTTSVSLRLPPGSVQQAGAAAVVGGALIESPSTAVPAPLLAGIQSTLSRTGDLRGLVSTSCAAAAPDTWLVGGGTTTGRRLRLLLTNPAATTAVVDVAVHGPAGRLPAPSGEGVVVAARSSVPVFVDALAPGVPGVAVHVSARTGRVHATLHDTVMRGLTPGGVDDVPPAAPAAKRQVVPGLYLSAGAASAGSAAGTVAEVAPQDAGATAVRVAVPGTEEAVVRVRLLGTDGLVDTGTPAVANVPGGAVTDIPVSGVPAGGYAAVVEADVPIVAGAVVGRVAPGAQPGVASPAEFGWAAAGHELSGSMLVPAVPGANGLLMLAAPDDEAELRVRELLPSGGLAAPRVLTVGAGSSAAMGLVVGSRGVMIDSIRSGALMAAMVGTVEEPSGPLITIVPVTPAVGAGAPAPDAVEDPRLGLDQDSRP